MVPQENNQLPRPLTLGEIKYDRHAQLTPLSMQVYRLNLLLPVIHGQRSCVRMARIRESSAGTVTCFC